MSVAALALLGCKPGGGGDDDDDKPATPIEADDAPEVLAQQICAQLFTCECAASTSFADEAECAEFVSAEIAAAIDPILDAGGSWNAECAGALAKTWSQWECLGPIMAEREASFNPLQCPIIKGTVGLGGECWRSSLGDDCQEGLSCIDQICVESPTLPVPVGGVCEYEWETLPCEAGSWCTYHPSGQRLCQALPSAGDSCAPSLDYLCGPAANDLICDSASSTCTPAPGEGEPCFDMFLCGPGTYCDGGQDFTCQPRQELGEGCGADTVCPVDASCLNNICEADPPAVCSAVGWF